MENSPCSDAKTAKIAKSIAMAEKQKLKAEQRAMKIAALAEERTLKEAQRVVKAQAKIDALTAQESTPKKRKLSLQAVDHDNIEQRLQALETKVALLQKRRKKRIKTELVNP